MKDNNHPFVSVIIPNYNHSDYLDIRINSILNQTYTNYELIILDDCSTDNSREVICKYGDNPHVSCIYFNETNSGSPFHQWEKGFSIAKGELIWIAESDDSCEPSFLQRMVEEFERNDNQCVLCFCRSVKIDTQGNIIGEEGLEKDSFFDGKSFIRQYLSRYNYVVNASSAVFRKKILDKVDRAYMQYRGCGDWVFWVEVSNTGKVAYINSPLNYYRQHNLSTTSLQTRSGKGIEELIRVFEHMMKKNYLGPKEIFHAKVVHIYSLRYGKEHGFFSKEVEEQYISRWNETLMVRVTVWLIAIMQKLGLHITNW